MDVTFKSENHEYESLDPNDQIKWISVTSFISLFKEKFDADMQSIKCSKNKKSKWYGLSPEEIKGYWASESNRSVIEGSLYHDLCETNLTEFDSVNREGISIPVIKPIYKDGVKYSPAQKLMEGIYPEHFVYLKSAGICGQSDKVEVIKNLVNIEDYKTNKEIKTEGFRNWQGITKKMLGVCSHLDECNFNHYALQLSLYMFMILKHNPGLSPGKMFIKHIIFEKKGEDKFGYPITKKDKDGNAIVQSIATHEVPYLKSEINNMINWYKENKEDINLR